MNLTKDSYTVSRATMEKVLAALENNWFSSGGDGDEYNNDDIIEANDLLKSEVEKQEALPVKEPK